MIGLSEFRDSGCGCKDLILRCFYLQMLNYDMLKPTNEMCLECKYQLELKLIPREKMLQLIKSASFKKKI